MLPLVILAISVGILLAYVHPTYSVSVTSLQNEIKGYDSALDAANMFASREAELINQRSNIDPSGLDRLEAFLPDGVDNVQLFLDLDALAGRTGMTILDLDVSDLSAAGAPKEGESASLGQQAPVDHIDLTLSATGTYTAMRAFIAGSEQSLRLLDLVDLTVKDSEKGLYTYDMKFRLYWLR
ncbi:hypothetical protein KKH15_02965 [Patescibacteria group bacterium]|nr:hypothetical protein [Patescibacteria group bacterium]MBU1755058.1 hypothetical protein [Patescibacteria group bacterium]